MRIIGTIDHPSLKITVFKMDNRLTLKFETSEFEQSYKFRLTNQLHNFEDVQRLVDSAFIEGVIENFKAQQHTRVQAMDRFIQQAPEDEFDVIV